MSSDLHNYGIIGFTADNVGIDRRIYTGLNEHRPCVKRIVQWWTSRCLFKWYQTRG